ncbi:hypothetical protein ACTNEO_10855 [Gracilibacillus sp. HCP3S3_G5_1]|uniref:hypothetical protein n=1 Tax=unclassified Gracilibacillus TaxID=2625209 RepID=UPI003F8864B9
MNIIYNSLEQAHLVEYTALTILSVITFKRIQTIETKRAKLKREIKDKTYRV